MSLASHDAILKRLTLIVWAVLMGYRYAWDRQQSHHRWKKTSVTFNDGELDERRTRSWLAVQRQSDAWGRQQWHLH